MIAWLGLISVLVAVTGAGLLAVRGFPALSSKKAVSADRLRMPVVWLLLGAVGAMLLLELGLLTNDYSIAYIANNHRVGTPLIFTVSAGWAALEGSIVLWGTVLAVLTFIAYRSLYKNDHPLAGGTMSVLGMVSLFWFATMATVANPFAVCAAAAETVGCALSSWAPWSPQDIPAAGRGANPLLQNHLLMAIHPPVLYLGYVGFSVPFAIGMASLAAIDHEDSWLRVTRTWTLVAWGFLTAGIVLGAWWSYEVLGWGGYWAWDPVENASFIPWLLATAFLHSSVVQLRRGVLSAWNYVLVIGAFAATILGTFLTRSGVIASVHSFTQSSIGPVLLAFLTVVLVASLALLAARLHLIGTSPRLESLASREGLFLANNLLLTAFAFVVLSGTLFPLAIEAIQGDTVGVGRPYFDRWAAPLSYCLILAMGIGPLTPYRLARPALMWERLRVPVRVALAIGAATVLIFSRDRHVIVVVVVSTLAVSAILSRLGHLAYSRSKSKGVGFMSAAAQLIRADTGFWGGQFSHIGVAVLAVGIGVSANHAVSGTVSLSPGDTAPFAGYELTYQGPFARSQPHREVLGGRIEVSRGGGTVATLTPALNTYRADMAPVVTPAVYTTLRGDLYVSLTRLDASGIVADVWSYPLQWMVWLGGLMTAAGAGLSLSGSLFRQRRRRGVAVG